MISLKDLTIFVELANGGSDDDGQMFHFVLVDADYPAPITVDVPRFTEVGGFSFGGG